MALVLKLEYLGIKEEISLSDADILRYINSLNFKTRLDYMTGIEVGTQSVSEQMTLIASYTNKLVNSELNPAQYRALKEFLKNKLADLEQVE